MRPLALREPQKRPTLRARRRRARTLIALLFASLVAAAVYGVSLASYLPRFSIQSVEVQGAKEIRTNLVRVYVETVLYSGAHSLFSRANIFLYPRMEIESAVREYFPRIESVHVSRGSLLATAVIVSIREREAFARWCAISESGFTGERVESCYVMDRSGLVFAPLEVRPESGLPAGAGPLTGFAPVGAATAGFATPYIFRGGFSTTSSPIGGAYLPGTFAGVSALLERLGQAGFNALSISAEGEQDFSIALARGFELRASFGADVSALVKNLELVLSSETLRGKEDELEYVDLRFGNRVYYKLRGGEQRSAE